MEFLNIPICGAVCVILSFFGFIFFIKPHAKDRADQRGISEYDIQRLIRSAERHARKTPGSTFKWNLRGTNIWGKFEVVNEEMGILHTVWRDADASDTGEIHVNRRFRTESN